LVSRIVRRFFVLASLPAAGRLVTAALKRGRVRGDLSKMIGNLASSLPLRSNEDERGGLRNYGIVCQVLVIGLLNFSKLQAIPGEMRTSWVNRAWLKERGAFYKPEPGRGGIKRYAF